MTQREVFFCYDLVQRQSILDALNLQEGILADQIIEMCEFLAEDLLIRAEYQSKTPTSNEAEYRVSKILYHLQEACRHADLDRDWVRRDQFWGNIFVDQNGNVPPVRWEKFCRLMRSIEAGQIHLRRYSERNPFYLKKEFTRPQATREASLLRQLSCCYYHILGRVPGRSKSTIGPFVRFAWVAISPILLERTPTIDNLNERWARMRYDPRKSILVTEAYTEMKARRLALQGVSSI